MIKTLTVPVLINGNFFPNEMQIALISGIPILESPHFTNRQNKYLQIKLKLALKKLGIKMPRKKILISFKNSLMVPKGYDLLEGSILLGLVSIIKNNPLPNNVYGSISLEGRIFFPENHINSFLNALKAFPELNRIVLPMDQLISSELDFKIQDFKTKRNQIQIPRILYIAVLLSLKHKINILIIGRSQSFFDKTKLLAEQLDLFNCNQINIKECHNLFSIPPLFLENLHYYSKSELLDLNSLNFHSSIATLESCPCGKFLSTQSCSCGVNYSKSYFKNFFQLIYKSFQLVINYDEDLSMQHLYTFDIEEIDFVINKLKFANIKHLQDSMIEIGNLLKIPINPKADLKMISEYKKQICL